MIWDANTIIALKDGGKDYITPPPIRYQPVDDATGRVKAYAGLTAAQENFCRYVANGESFAASYRKAYNTRPDLRPDSVYNRAGALAKREKIKTRIDQLLSERESVAVNDYAQIRKFVVERLQLEALNCKTDAVRLKALELLGKIDKIQLFADAPKEEDIKASGKDIGKELGARLTKLLGSKVDVEGVIGGSAPSKE